ncbi:hypothetical protein [Bacillus cereus group sp. BfR-BA-01403]|uniref:hypothetical protein n=1 Tax=Bacillus cereus group sp. BfR-BA-01403 TaxID=2920336 RepID=UPI001F59A394|nr:hypothetical protein [Bacillus cereus group sp. BfR-BA-01403]
MIIVLEKGGFDWVAFAGAFIFGLAVFVAITAIWYQNRQFKKQREPVIGPAIKDFDLELPETHLDWETGEKLDDKFSGTTIPVYNYGGTAAINISYNYKLINLDEKEKCLNNFPKSTSHEIKIDAINKEKNLLICFFQIKR